MGANRLYRWGLIVALLTMSCSGASLEGGQSGTGLSAIVGNVAAVGGMADVVQIQVTVQGSTVTGVTDAMGNFALSGDVSGPEVLVFERARDDLFAEVEVVVPAGGRLELGDIEIDAEEGRATPTQRFIEFEGVIDVVDCAAGELQVATRLEGVKSIFVLPLADAFVHDEAGNPVACTALSPGVEVNVNANVNDVGRLSNADVEVTGGGEDGGEIDNDGGNDGSGIEDGQSEQGQGDPGQDGTQQDDEQPQGSTQDSKTGEMQGDSGSGDELGFRGRSE